MKIFICILFLVLYLDLHLRQGIVLKQNMRILKILEVGTE